VSHGILSFISEQYRLMRLVLTPDGIRGLGRNSKKNGTEEMNKCWAYQPGVRVFCDPVFRPSSLGAELLRHYAVSARVGGEQSALARGNTMQNERHWARWLVIVCAVFLTWSGSVSADPPVFTEIGRDILGMGRIAQSHFAIADVDNDGLADVVFTGDVFNPALLAIGRRADGSIGFKQILPLPYSYGTIVRVLTAQVAGITHIYLVADDGTVDDYAGWPLAKSTSFAVHATVSSAVTTQLYGDGSNQLLVLTADHLYAYALDTRQPLWNYAISGASDLVVAQLDADGEQEVVLNSSPGLVIDSLTRTVDWQYSSSSFAALATGHLLGDGTTQFMAVAPPSYSAFTVYGGSPPSPMWSAGNYSGGIAALTAADIDNNGREVVVEADSQWGTVNVFDPTTHQQRFSISKAGSGINALAAPDLDGDHVPEIIFAVTYPTGDAGIVIANGTTGQTKWSYIPHDARFSRVAIGDVDGDGAQELVVADYGWTSRGGVEIFDFASGALKWQSQLTTANGYDPFEISTSRILLVPHANGIGQDIVLAGTMFYDGKITVLDGVTHNATLLTGQPGFVPLYGRAVVDATLVDFDNDGTLDFAVATAPTNTSVSGAELLVFSGKDGQLLWTSPPITSSGSTILSVIASGPATSPSSELIAVQTNDMVAYNMQTHALDWTLPVVADGATFIPSSSRNAENSRDAEIAVFQTTGTIRFYDAATHASLRILAVPPPLNAVQPLDARHLLVASGNALAVLDSYDPAIPACTNYLGYFLGDGNRLAASSMGGGQWLVASGNQMVFRHLLSIDAVFADSFATGSRTPHCTAVY
jgi:hypothetical protein